MNTAMGVPVDLAKAQSYYLAYFKHNSLELTSIKLATFFCSGAGLYSDDGVIRDPERGVEILKRH